MKPIFQIGRHRFNSIQMQWLFDVSALVFSRELTTDLFGFDIIDHAYMKYCAGKRNSLTLRILHFASGKHGVNMRYIKLRFTHIYLCYNEVNLMFTLLCKCGKGLVYACLHIANRMSNVNLHLV